MTGMEDILNTREWRSGQIKLILARYSPDAVISFKLNIPGRDKNNELFEKIFLEGWNVITDKTKIENIFAKYISLPAGMEGFQAVNINPLLLKKLMIQIEENHPLGRIFDIDVINNSGEIVKRSELGFEPRKCFICNENAFICARNAVHPLEELLNKIIKLYDNYCKK